MTDKIARSRKLLLLIPSSRKGLGDLIVDHGGGELASGSTGRVLDRFLEAAAGPLARYLNWTLWELPIEKPTLEDFSGAGLEPPSTINMQSISEFVSVGLIIVMRGEDSIPELSKGDRSILMEIAKQGGTVRMGLLAERLNRTAMALRRRLKFLELLGLVKRTGTAGSMQYVLARPFPEDLEQPISSLSDDSPSPEGD